MKKTLLGLMVAATLVLAGGCGGDGKVDRQLVLVAKEINKSCPAMVDEVTRIDSVYAVPGKLFVYDYTFIGDPDSDAVESIDVLKEQIIDGIKSRLDDMKYMRDNEVNLKYRYKDNEGNLLFEIDITSDMYKDN